MTEVTNYLIYSGALSIATPLAMLYNLTKVGTPIPTCITIVKGVTRLFPGQALARCSQLYVATNIATTHHPILGFAFMGLTQGMIYNHCISHWLKTPNVFKGVTRGLGFAVPRDVVSQGIPYLSNTPLLPTSLTATMMSQGLHNCQVHMQTNPTVSYKGCIRSLYNQHGMSALYKGVGGRMGLITVTNFVNSYSLQW